MWSIRTDNQNRQPTIAEIVAQVESASKAQPATHRLGMNPDGVFVDQGGGEYRQVAEDLDADRLAQVASEPAPIVWDS